MAAAGKFNRSNPAVKRILQEVKEMQSNPSPDFMALPLEPSGRFEIQKKICLSISNYHPEHWQPSWSVCYTQLSQTICVHAYAALVALIAFMPTNPGGALGSLDYKKEDRRALAIKSVKHHQNSLPGMSVIDEIHEQMLSKAPLVPQLLTIGNEEETNKTSPDTFDEHDVKAAGVNTSGSSSGSANNTDLPKPDSESEVAENIVGAQSDVIPRDNGPRVVIAPQNPVLTIQKPKHDRLLTLAAFGLTLAIMALVIKKFFKINGLAGYIEGKF
ncbi:hypothetical protein ZWY2020_034649 [Hordeum vulgare]|nr:hypothetical protein ZWY2020_034649 [Hordeum vulgare]